MRYLERKGNTQVIRIEKIANLIYLKSAAADKMTKAKAYELSKFNIPVISLYPKIVRTEAVLQNKGHFDFNNSESPEFTGLVISKIASDKKAIENTGQILIVAEEAIKYGIKNIDGKQPKPLSLDEI
jgi:short-subunit dehydrogenase